MEPNTMICDTPEALRFFASAAPNTDAEWMLKAADEIERLRLTDAERGAIETAIDCVRDRLEGYEDCESTKTTLRNLLARSTTSTT